MCLYVCAHVHIRPSSWKATVTTPWWRRSLMFTWLSWKLANQKLPFDMSLLHLELSLTRYVKRNTNTCNHMDTQPTLQLITYMSLHVVLLFITSKIIFQDLSALFIVQDKARYEHQTFPVCDGASCFFVRGLIFFIIFLDSFQCFSLWLKVIVDLTRSQSGAVVHSGVVNSRLPYRWVRGTVEILLRRVHVISKVWEQ